MQKYRTSPINTFLAFARVLKMKCISLEYCRKKAFKLITSINIFLLAFEMKTLIAYSALIDVEGTFMASQAGIPYLWA